jgi:hypothetical protein
MVALLNEEPQPRSRRRKDSPTQSVVEAAETPPPAAEPMNWTSPAIMAGLVVLALWLLSIWTRGGG